MDTEPESTGGSRQPPQTPEADARHGWLCLVKVGCDAITTQTLQKDVCHHLTLLPSALRFSECLPLLCVVCWASRCAKAYMLTPSAQPQRYIWLCPNLVLRQVWKHKRARVESFESCAGEMVHEPEIDGSQRRFAQQETAGIAKARICV